LNLWGNAREGSNVRTQLQTRTRAPAEGEPPAKPFNEKAPAVSQTPETAGRRPAMPMNQRPATVNVSGVSHSYGTPGGARVQALAGMTVHGAEHEVLAVVGPSGCGKTTLLELICGLQDPDEGAIECAPAALMPQRDLLMPWLSALDNAALALRVAHVSRARAREQAGRLFAELGLEGFERARPHELSGGMRQRVAFVRTLLSGKEVLCLDEPFGALDAITRAEMHAWLADALAREPRTVVLVTHDVEEAVVLADRVAVLSPRPGRVMRELEVELGRPRSRTDPQVVALRERALQALGQGSAE
jgi:ABC-type nitrate/sulfonate/bicarbonate transport system ATPase subunit